MEGNLFEVLLNLMLGSGLLIGLGLIPAISLIRILDPGADRLRMVMLAPAASLLILYGLAGWLVVIRGVHSVGALVMLILIVNVLAATLGWQRDVVRVRRLSAWERLEEIAEAAEAEGGTVSLEEDVVAERRYSALIQTGRPRWLPWALAISALVCLTPLFILARPMGVDWLGFATLSHRLAETGSLELPSPSAGRWTYPPAFPALAAFLEQAIGLSPGDSVHLLGQISLLAVVWGVAGAADRWGAAAPTLLALCLAPALFAKSFDSGYPTVASQLGLVLGLLVLVKPPRERSRRMDLLFAFGVAFVGVIHPTGSLYLGALLLAWMGAHRWSAQRDSQHAGRLALMSAVVIGGATILVMGVFAPRMLDTPVWAEYGWQGGWPLLAYNGPILLGLAGWSLWRFQASFEVWLLGLWLALLWALTWVHLFDGLVGIPLLTLVAYMLYSMALHAFHVPLAVLAGIVLAKVPRLTARLRERRMDEVHEEEDIVADGAEMSLLELTLAEPSENRPVQALIGIAIAFILLSHIVLFGVASHPDLEAQTPGDRELRSAIAALPSDSVLYTETAHWGILYDTPTELGQTTFPSLGLLTVEERIQWRIERAIIADDLETLTDFKVSHAVTSPKGQMGHVLAQSEHWAILADEEGSRLWIFEAEPTSASLKISNFTIPIRATCGEGCDWRPDPWIEGNAMPFLTNGDLDLQNITLPRQHRDVDLAVNVQHSGSADISLSITVCDLGTETCSTATTRTAGGHETTTVLHHSDFRGEIEVHIEVEGGGQTWINPSGMSGRGDRILDEEGLTVHWLEVRDL